MGLLERIKDIEHEMARTQKNKATEHHLGLLKAKLARLRTQLMEPQKGGGGKGEATFEAKKSGNARVALIGFPSVGKSTLLSCVTETESETAAYEFTTLTAVTGVLQYKDARIQIVDLPGIIEGACEGKGRGRQVIAAARNSDMVLMLLDASKGAVHKKLLTYELEAVGIRLNQRKPAISLVRTVGGGVRYTTTVAQSHIDERLAKQILHEYRIFNATVLIREDITVDQFIDVIEGNRRYLPCLYVYNKIDCINVEELDRLARVPDSAVVSCEFKWNIDGLIAAIWRHLRLLRVYTRKRGEAPDFTDPIILRSGATVEDVCLGVHKDMAAQFKYALVWGRSAKHYPQRVGLSHELADEDVVQVAI